MRLQRLSGTFNVIKPVIYTFLKRGCELTQLTQKLTLLDQVMQRGKAFVKDVFHRAYFFQ